jgi:hypothetical protein
VKRRLEKDSLIAVGEAVNGFLEADWVRGV